MSGDDQQSKNSLSSSLIRRLVYGVILVNLILCAMAGLYLLHSWKDVEQSNAVVTQNLAKVVEDTISEAINKINLCLLALKDEVEEQLAGGGIDGESLNHFIATMCTRVPDLDGLYVADAEGDVLQTAGVAKQATISDRDYFLRLRDDPEAGLVFGKPVVGRISGEWQITIGRRLNHKDGSFAGIVFAQLTADHFAKTFSHIDVGKNGSIALRTTEFELIARYPETRGLVSEADRKRVSATFRDLLATGVKEGTFKARYPLDNIERLYTFHRIGDHPLVINVGRATGEYTAKWRKEAAIALALMLLFSAGSIVYSRALIQRWRIEIQSEKNLKRVNEELEQRVQERTAELSAKTIELQKSEVRYRTIADFTSEWEYWISPEGEFLYISPCCETVTGYSREAFFSDPQLMERIVHPDDLQRYCSHLHSSDVREHSEPIDFRIITRGGEERWVGHRCTQVFDDKGIGIGWRASNRDITERVRIEEHLRQLNEELDQRVALRTEELERLNRDLESFCYSLSHELRAPIARLEGFSTVLTEAAADKDLDESARIAERISVASKRLRDVIDNLLLLNRISRAEPAVETVDLSEMARQIMAELLAELKDRSVTVVIKPGITVQGDRSMLSVCLKNLLANAVKYTVHNPAAKVEFGESCQSGELVYFIRDNGVGFNVAYSGKLFEPFCRLHQQGEYDGSGIGLPIVQRIVERHGGRVWADAKEGEGATFYFTLPLHASWPGPKEAQESLARMMDKQSAEIRAAELSSIESLAILAEYNDKSTEKHLSRIRYYAALVARKLSEKSKYRTYLSSSPNYIQDLSAASILHDIGKTVLSNDILAKPGIYKPHEFEQMKMHTIVAGDILSRGNRSYVTHYGKDSYLALARDIALYHHEKWDGTGYPKGLSGEYIPLSARIVALVDVYDALRSERPYKEAWSHEKTVETIAAERGAHFDPEVVDAFMEIHEEFKRVADRDDD